MKRCWPCVPGPRGAERPDASDRRASSSDRKVGELEVAEGDVQAMGAAATVAEVGMPQRACRGSFCLIGGRRVELG